MKINIVNSASKSQETDSTNNFMTCNFQALISDNKPSNLHNLCSNNFTVAGDHPPPLLRRIRPAVPPPIICSNAFFSPSTTSSPCSQSSPCVQSPWTGAGAGGVDRTIPPKHGLVGTVIREDGYVYSIAASGDFLYTGSESKNIRVWKNMKEFSAFKSGSGLVKAIVVSGERIFTGHQDGKVRIWKRNGNNQKKSYVRVGNLPKSQDLIVKSMNPRNYVEVRRKRNVPWIKHYDAVSCLSIDPHHGLLYSGSWDKTLKVWRISDSKCLESIQAHDDAVNSVAAAFAGMVFTGSADGTVKAWRRSYRARNHNRATTRHVLVETLLKQEHAVTSLAAASDGDAGVVYAGSSDGLVSFWERENGAVVYGGVLRGHKSAVLCVAVGGKLVASGSADNSICMWRRDVGGEHACVAVLVGHDGPVKCLEVAKDTWTAEMEEEEGRSNWIVYSGSLDKTLKIWRVAEDLNQD